MAENSTRNADGTFRRGFTGNPNGRLSKARELAYLQVVKEVMTMERWRGVLVRAVNDALGMEIEDGKVIRDPESTSSGRNAARTFLRDTLLGKPVQSLRVNDYEDAHDEYAHMTDDELRAIILEAAIEDAEAGDNASRNWVEYQQQKA